MLIYIREDISCKILENHNLPDDIKCLIVDLNFRKFKLLPLATYHPPPAWYPCITNYEKYILVGDFNAKRQMIKRVTFWGLMV